MKQFTRHNEYKDLSGNVYSTEQTCVDYDGIVEHFGATRYYVNGEEVVFWEFNFWATENKPISVSVIHFEQQKFNRVLYDRQ
jgi:hypothetical protein